MCSGNGRTTAQSMMSLCLDSGPHSPSSSCLPSLLTNLLPQPVFASLRSATLPGFASDGSMCSKYSASASNTTLSLRTVAWNRTSPAGNACLILERLFGLVALPLTIRNDTSDANLRVRD